MSIVADADVTIPPPPSAPSRRLYDKFAIVTGACSGLGAALLPLLKDKGYLTLEFDAKHGDDVRAPGNVVEQLRALGIDRLDLLVNCAGVNRIDWLENFSDADWDEVLDTNAKGIFTMSKACLPLLKESKGTIVNIVSNASHMPMTCSAAYNASKGAAHILTLQLARELTKKYGITVFGVSPNKLAGTGMSLAIEEQVVKTRGWTHQQAQQYQLNALLTGEETPPQAVAEFIAFLLSTKERHKFLTGCIIPYGA